jgi:hypothetical protein
MVFCCGQVLCGRGRRNEEQSAVHDGVVSSTALLDLALPSTPSVAGRLDKATASVSATSALRLGQVIPVGMDAVLGEVRI